MTLRQGRLLAILEASLGGLPVITDEVPVEEEVAILGRKVAVLGEHAHTLAQSLESPWPDLRSALLRMASTSRGSRIPTAAEEVPGWDSAPQIPRATPDGGMEPLPEDLLCAEAIMLALEAVQIAAIAPDPAAVALLGTGGKLLEAVSQVLAALADPGKEPA